MTRWRRKIIWFFVALAVITFIIIGFFLMVPEPPAEEIEVARQALLKARESKAEVYAKDIFREAGLYYDSAMQAWQTENQRFILFRDYSAVMAFAEISIEQSEAASKQTKSQSVDLERSTRKLIASLNDLINEINNIYSRLPLAKQTRKEIAKGKLLLSESNVALRNGSYTEADKKLKQAETLFKNAHQSADNLLSEYFENHRQWKEWMNQTIIESKSKRSTVVIVDKFASKCYVYKNGRPVAEFEVELGKNWVGDKRYKGDNATPEGRYHVTQKKEGSATKYYKALLINYPNEDDKKRFSSEVANGSLPRNMKIGGLIEIHGNGGKGSDWTEGCVALTDSDMDILYNMVNVGTPVTIIGSVISLNEILKR